MYEYKFNLSRVIDGDTVDGSIDLGFGIFLHERIRLAGINAPATRLQKSITNAKKRAQEKERGMKAKARLKELLKEGSRQPEGLFIATFLDKKGKYGRILGDIKYVYARDLYNHKPGAKPWAGWKSVNSQLVQEELAEPIKI